MRAAEARKHMQALFAAGAFNPKQTVYAAVMLVANEIPSNFRDDPAMERNWRRLADLVHLDADALAGEGR